MKKWMLEQCPVCQAGAPKPVEYCRRCGAYLLLLVKAWNESERLRSEREENEEPWKSG